MKLLVLHTRLSGYTTACLSAFKTSTQSELLVFAWAAQASSPFDAKIFGSLGEVLVRNDYSVDQMWSRITKYKPDAVLLSGWVDSGYTSICRRLKSRGIPVISGSDTQWRGGYRQRVAALTAPLYVNRFISVMWVCGDRQRVFAEKLGYRGDQCWDGYYSCDYESFAQASRFCDDERLNDPHFLFIGRYVEEKGIADLIEGYRQYRDKVDNPWSLVCAGAGPLVGEIAGVATKNLGFVQPNDLPNIMARAAAFILPSHYEPWGVVVHEAASAGLPLIVSSVCGASDHLLENGRNGYNFPSGDVSLLASRMKDIHQLSSLEYSGFSDRSRELAAQYTPARWASTLYEGIQGCNPPEKALD